MAKTHQRGRTSSRLTDPALYLRILVTAEIAFSVGLMFSGSLELGAWMSAVSGCSACEQNWA